VEGESQESKGEDNAGHFSDQQGDGTSSGGGFFDDGHTSVIGGLTRSLKL
jgi:hypothetical protein